MAKVILSKEKGKTAGRIRLGSTSVGTKRVRDAAGRIRELRTLDTESDTFATDLTYVFGRNVAAARRENKRVIGVPDVAPARD